MTKFVELFIQLFVRGIWEEGMFLFGTLLLANAEIPKKKFILTSLCFAVFVLMVRELPISYGIHTLINLICLNLLSILLFNVNLEQAIKSTVIITCVVFALEGLNGLALQYFVGSERVTEIVNDPVEKILYFIPSTLLLFVFNYLLYRFKRKKGNKEADVGAVE